MKPFLGIGKYQQEVILACSIFGMLLLFGLGLSDATQQNTYPDQNLFCISAVLLIIEHNAELQQLEKNEELRHNNPSCYLQDFRHADTVFNPANRFLERYVCT